MALLDFLFNGKPPASTTTYGNTTSSMPTWYSDYTQGLISRANAIAATDYTPYTGARIATPTGQQQSAWEGINQQANAYGINNQSNPFNQALQNTGNVLGQTGLGQYNNAGFQNLQRAGQYDPYSAGIGNLNTASGVVANNLGTTSTQGIGNYLNPFTQNVVAEAGRLGQENLANNLSGIQDRFVRSGQYGGSRMGQALASAGRAGARDITGQQSALLNQGYNQALGASQADLTRQLQGAQQLGQLGTSAGALANTASQNFQNLGAQYGNFGAQDLTRQLQLAAQQGALGQQRAATGLQQQQAQELAGQAQQQQAQRNLDLAYSDYQKQLQYPYEQASFLNNIIRGLQVPTSQSTQSTGPASVYQPSPLSQLGSLGAGLAGILKAT